MTVSSFRCLLLSLLLAAAAGPCNVWATHIVGGEVTYQYLGAADTGNLYRIKLSIYEDCLNGTASAIRADSLAFITTDDGNGVFFHFDTVAYTSAVIVPANFNNACVSNIPATCLQRKDYYLDLVLPPNATGYNVTYQRCCRNAAIVNIKDPANIGATYYCTIPPVSAAANNNSAVFKNFPPQIICVNIPLVYDHSATDADGDSLTYELCNSLLCPNTGNVDREPFVPPYQNVTYISPYSYLAPLTAFPAFTIDPVTGFISGTPNRVGRYLITVCCNEWRHGVMINTVKREFQFVVTNCSKNVVADIPLLTTLPNTFQLNCRDRTIHFINTSTGGVTWLWDFGPPNSPHDTEFEPTFTYPANGTYSVKLVANPGTTCSDSIIRLVRIYPVFHAQFSTADTQCAGGPVLFQDRTIDSFPPAMYWKWYFGDGDTSSLQNPVHSFALSGIYDVVLATQNTHSCIDTAFRQILIDNFKPFAGSDTSIVKGESMQFHATGGISYEWSPPTNLESFDSYNPIGYYPDTGLYSYTVRVVSPYGCVGYDTVNVTVVDHAAFAMPNAFTPNGDGRNDVFRPYAIGYRSLSYFRVFDRWGEEVYFSTSMEEGWDGTYRGKPADMGTYYWEISYTDRLGKQGTMKGDVVLVR